MLDDDEGLRDFDGEGRVEVARNGVRLRAGNNQMGQ